MPVAKKNFQVVCGENMFIKCPWQKYVYKFSVAKNVFKLSEAKMCFLTVFI